MFPLHLRTFRRRTFPVRLRDVMVHRGILAQGTQVFRVATPSPPPRPPPLEKDKSSTSMYRARHRLVLLHHTWSPNWANLFPNPEKKGLPFVLSQHCIHDGHGTSTLSSSSWTPRGASLARVQHRSQTQASPCSLPTTSCKSFLTNTRWSNF